jgi:hypothetical protein
VPLVQTVAKEAGINIILVPSNFSSNMALFLEKAKWIVAEFSKFPPTDAVNAKGLNIWAAQEELPGDDGKHCWYPPTSAPELGSPPPHPHGYRSHPRRIRTDTDLTPAHIRTGTGLTPAHLLWDRAHPSPTSAPGLGSP